MDTERLVQDFAQVAALAGRALEASAIQVEMLKAPHRPPSRLPARAPGTRSGADSEIAGAECE